MRTNNQRIQDADPTGDLLPEDRHARKQAKALIGTSMWEDIEREVETERFNRMLMLGGLIVLLTTAVLLFFRII